MAVSCFAARARPIIIAIPSWSQNSALPPGGAPEKLQHNVILSFLHACESKLTGVGEVFDSRLRTASEGTYDSSHLKPSMECTVQPCDVHAVLCSDPAAFTETWHVVHVQSQAVFWQ